MSKRNDEKAVNELIKKFKLFLPPAWERSRTDELTGGLIKPGTLANRMSENTGPENTFSLGRRRGIERDGFLDWFKTELLKDDRNGTFDLAEIRARKQKR